MSFTSISSSAIAVGKAATASLWTIVKNNFDWLYGQVGSLTSQDIANNSFEIDSNADGVPDNWTFTSYPSGTGAIDSTVPAHGANCVKCVHPGGAGNGGGYWESDYFPFSEYLNQSESFGFFNWATNAAMHNQVIIRFYDKSKVYISSTTIYDNQANPGSPVFYIVGLAAADVPANTKYIKVRCAGGVSDINQAGTAYFDFVTLNPVQMQPFLAGAICRGTFTIAQNTNNTNGYVDAGSAAFAFSGKIIPIFRAFTVNIIFNAEMKVDSGHTGYQRFKIGAVYSNEQTTTNTAYESKSYTINLPANSVGPWTIVQQLHSDQNGYVAYGRKTSDTTATMQAVL